MKRVANNKFWKYAKFSTILFMVFAIIFSAVLMKNRTKPELEI
ncbi:hypothetical protein [Methanosarcina sp. MSH10X1]|nr:hypothetical protein [Methanosarcina sp. MSH10X1]